MKQLINCAFAVLFLTVLFAGCKGNVMSQSEKLFIKMVHKTAGTLDLDENQKVQLERFKMEIRKNFLEGQKEKEEAAVKIEEAGMKKPRHSKDILLVARTPSERNGANQPWLGSHT